MRFLPHHNTAAARAAALAGIVFGLGMTLGAANFIDWLF